MSTIKSIACRRVLNSHVEFTNEFIVELDDGSVGVGSSPQGETISIYEDKKISIDPATIIERIKSDGYFGRSLTQEDFDDYLQQRIPFFGRNNVCGISLAYFNATGASRSLFELFDKSAAKLTPPHICCNILNGGWHAYTNPVLSDFHEYILVSKSNNIEEVIGQHNEIQRAVKEKLISQTKTVVSGNVVNRFATADNRECIEFLLNIRDSLGLVRCIRSDDRRVGRRPLDRRRLPARHHRRLGAIKRGVLRVLAGHHQTVQSPLSRRSVPREGSGGLAAIDDLAASVLRDRRQLLFVRCRENRRGRRRRIYTRRDHQAEPGRHGHGRAARESTLPSAPTRSPSPRIGPSAPNRPSSPR